MACERTDKRCQISYRKGYKRQREERERRSRTGLLSSSTTFFLDHSDPTILSSLLFLQHMKQTPHQWCYTYSSQQNLSPDIHIYSLIFFRSLFKHHLIRDPFVYFYQGPFAYFALTKLQKIPAFPTALVYFIFSRVLTSIWYLLIYVIMYVFTICLSQQ